MFCSKCGNEIPEGATICGVCGTPVNQNGANSQYRSENGQNIYGEPAPVYSGQTQNQSYSYQNNPYQTNQYQNNMYNSYSNQGYGTPQDMDGGAMGMAVASLILGIVALILSCCLGGTWWLDIIIAVAGLVFGIISVHKNSSGKGMAIAGIICSSIAIVMVIVLLIVGFAALIFIKNLFMY